MEKSLRRRLESQSSFGSKQYNPLEKVLDMKEYFDKQHKREEKGQKVIQAESVETGRVRISDKRDSLVFKLIKPAFLNHRCLPKYF